MKKTIFFIIIFIMFIIGLNYIVNKTIETRYSNKCIPVADELCYERDGILYGNYNCDTASRICNASCIVNHALLNISFTCLK